jgi:hypothetical protein
VEVGATVLEETDSLAIEDDGLDGQALEGFDDERERRRPVPAVAGPQPHDATLAPGDDPPAVRLDRELPAHR